MGLNHLYRFAVLFIPSTPFFIIHCVEDKEIWLTSHEGCFIILCQSLIASIFNTECLDKVLEKKSELFSEMVRQDIEELRACFKAKAYKATLIMAGSILEAILIDWVSDMSGKNYFEEDFEPEDRKGYKEKAGLKEYINAVKYIEYPRWMDGAEMAHDIRDKRNLVHAKLGIYSDDINEETCLMVIDYLERVIQTRKERMYFRYDKRKIESFRR